MFLPCPTLCLVTEGLSVDFNLNAIQMISAEIHVLLGGAGLEQEIKQIAGAELAGGVVPTHPHLHPILGMGCVGWEALHLSPQCARAFVCIWDKARNAVYAGAGAFPPQSLSTAPHSVSAPRMGG